MKKLLLIFAGLLFLQPAFAQENAYAELKERANMPYRELNHA